ncbi:hypothetical protein Bphy_0025 [Paraburkholderia phymatum STM815]|uniref:PAAR repeat-containing protein n=1 Tax=Paraburkholderia phymatum (strain DSM 17167 / CIP 108236 / LMG 21445 / STM815) TaxID=391038 RepID=B2JJT3_PARP8|nr:hypothetical protein Bphy_0025 [Paraburkholderia phymatum STM815]
MTDFIRLGDTTDHGGKVNTESDRAWVVRANEPKGKKSMGKALVCNGDETTTVGHVIAKASTMFDGERRIALDRGDLSQVSGRASDSRYGNGDGRGRACERTRRRPGAVSMRGQSRQGES